MVTACAVSYAILTPELALPPLGPRLPPGQVLYPSLVLSIQLASASSVALLRSVLRVSPSVVPSTVRCPRFVICAGARDSRIEFSLSAPRQSVPDPKQLDRYSRKLNSRQATNQSSLVAPHSNPILPRPAVVNLLRQTPALKLGPLQ